MNKLVGSSKLNMKAFNRSQILGFLRKKGPCARRDIACETSLTAACISMTIAELLQEKVVCEKGAAKEAAKPGKQSALIDINGSCACTLGCIAGDGLLYCGIADLRGRVLFALPPTPFDVRSEDSLKFGLLKAIQALQRHKACSCIGVGVGINNEILEWSQRGMALLATLQLFLRKRLRLQNVAVELSSRALALAQIDFGKRPDLDNMVFLQVANSLDMALTIGGEVWPGAHNNIGRLNHVVIDPGGVPCECGKRGCVKTMMTVEGILERAKKVYSKKDTPKLYELTGGKPEAMVYDHLKIAAKAGDRPIAELYRLDDALFTSLLFNFMTLLDPNKCIIQGMGLYAEELVERLNAHAVQLLGEGYHDFYELSFIGEENMFLGGNALAARRFFYGAADLPDAPPHTGRLSVL